MKKYLPLFATVFLVYVSPNLFSQIAISPSNATPDPKAMLDIISVNTGLLIPRVNLGVEGVGGGNLAASNPEALFIYNTNPSYGNGKGYYYWNGSSWDRVVTESISNPGTVTNVATGSGLTGGPITATGTIAIANSAVTNSMLQNSSITVNTGTGLSGGGTVTLGGTLNLVNTGDTNAGDDIITGTTADGDLSGTYPNPTVDGLQGNAVSATAPTTNNVLAWNGTAWAPSDKGVPSGLITMWSGSKASIPTGWALCDGLNGTPNLLDRFILSVAVSNYTAGDINTSGGSNSTHAITLAELPSHTHTGTSDATTVTGSFAGTAATLTHTASFAGTNATISHTASFSGTAVTSTATNTDHTHGWGGVWNNDNSTVGSVPYGDGNSNLYSDGIGYWGMGVGGGIGVTTSSTNTDHYHGWGNVWNTGDSNADWKIISDGWSWWNGGWTNFSGAWAGWHGHNYETRSGFSGWGQSYGTGSGGWGGAGVIANNGAEMIKHRHWIEPNNTGWMSQNVTHNHTATIPNHRHWIQARNTGAMSANASHSHSVTAAGTVTVNNASYTPAGTVTVNNAAYTPAGTISTNSHTHTFTTGSTGAGTPIDFKPAYYKLAYIMKL